MVYKRPVQSLRSRVTGKSNRKLILLTPEASSNVEYFENVDVVPSRHDDLLAQMQEMRGRVYLAEGAIQEWQLRDGRHQLDADAVSWHVLILDETQRVCGCVRYREYRRPVRFCDLGVYQSALARTDGWGLHLKRAVETEVQLAARLGSAFVELGGWALTEEIRATSEALRMVLMTYGLSQARGGAVGISTATKRNCSSSILRKMGGRSLDSAGVEIPTYYDPHYGCEMEVLRFYSWSPNPRYGQWVEEARDELSEAPVIARSPGRPASHESANAAAASVY